MRADSKKILVILGHPARERESFCEVLAMAYRNGAEKAGYSVKFLKLATMKFDPVLHEGYRMEQPLEPDILDAQEKLLWADHWVIVYPLWQFMIPALLKGFLERSFTRGFAYNLNGHNPAPAKFLRGKSVRLIQTMTMPSFIYRWIAGEHGAKAFKNMLSFCGIAPIRVTYCGLAESPNDAVRKRYINMVNKLGKEGI